jgi:hypothetical protein
MGPGRGSTWFTKSTKSALHGSVRGGAGGGSCGDGALGIMKIARMGLIFDNGGSPEASSIAAGDVAGWARCGCSGSGSEPTCDS